MAILACDVDSVVINLSESWLNLYNRDWNDNLKPENILSWGTHEYVRPECGRAIYDYLLLPEIYDKAQPIAGAVRGVYSLRKAGHRVIFVTSCPRGVGGPKFEWLSRYGILEDEADFIIARDKGLIKADLLIDDYQENIKRFGVHKGILFKLPDQPWSKPDGLEFIANGWSEVGREVERVLSLRTVTSEF
jgi:5'(3')-deoxyribonucleotidase